MVFKKSMFIKPNNELEGRELKNEYVPAVPEELCISCPSCKNIVFVSELTANNSVCPKCNHHFKMNARTRIQTIADENTFVETNADYLSDDILDFPGYKEKLNKARDNSKENESVITGRCNIGGHRCALFVMEPDFMMGSMGRVTGEKITELFEMASKERLPVLGFTVSGGARIQEGILSLMQMAKTAGAAKYHSDAGNLYIAVLTNPTTGGVMASFAMLGDIILAEPNALIAFAGPRVIEQTMLQKLPEGFQRAEFLLEKGFVDSIVDRKDQRRVIAYLLQLHQRRSCNGCL